MSKYHIERSCGHTEDIQIYGTNSHGERERRAEWEAGRMCRECYLAAREVERKAAAAKALADAATAGLPNLSGSEKQISWAVQIRAEQAKILDDINHPPAHLPAMFAAAHADLIAMCRRILQESRASWWIDHRGDNVFRAAAQEMDLYLYIYAA